MSEPQTRRYRREDVATFRKTSERFGGLSNMAPGYPIVILGYRIRTAEALYQACRFPHMPDVQNIILSQSSPMTAKMRSKPFRNDTRPDWDIIRVPIMKWCLRVKLVQNWSKFSELLLSTGDLPIVEESRKDNFWGAIPDEQFLEGQNVLGRLLMELRGLLFSDPNQLLSVKPVAIPEFNLFDQPIGTIEAHSRSSQCQETASYNTLGSINPSNLMQWR